MQHFIITYDFDNTTNRRDFVAEFEKILVDYGFHKQITNQSTYFGTYRDKQSLATDLLNATSKLNWALNDIVTIYYPKVSKGIGQNIPDIGSHSFKSEGNLIRHHNIL